jgi:hypothetical protein
MLLSDLENKGLPIVQSLRLGSALMGPQVLLWASKSPPHGNESTVNPISFIYKGLIFVISSAGSKQQYRALVANPSL